MKRNGIITAACIGIFCLSAIIHGLSLKQAQEFLVYKNLENVTAYQEYCKKAYEKNEAKALWYPSVDVVGSYNYFSERNSVHYGPVNMSIGAKYRAEAGVDVSWPITQAFVNIYNVRYRHLALMAKEAQNSGLRNLLSFRLGAMFFMWNMSFRQAEVHTTLVSQLADLANQAQNLKASGLAAGTKVLDAKARLASARADLVAAQNQCDSLKFEILNFIQCADSSFAPDDYSFGLDSQALASLDTVSFNSGRPELSALDYTADQLSVFQKIISGQKYPALVAFAGYRYANPGLAMGDSAFMGYGVAGVQLKWNLFDGFRVSSQHKQASQQQEIVKTQRKQLLDTWENAIKNAKMQLARAMKQSEAADASLAAAEAVVTDAKNGLSAGVATQTDLLNALTAHARAALAVKQAAFMKNMAVLQLYFASGRELKF